MPFSQWVSRCQAPAAQTVPVDLELLSQFFNVAAPSRPALICWTDRAPTAIIVTLPSLPGPDQMSKTQITTYDLFHDFGGTAEDGLDTGVQVVARHPVLQHVAVAAV